MFFLKEGKHEGTGMNPSPSYAPMTIDAQQIDKVEAVGGEVEVTLTAMPRDSDGPSGEIRIRFDLEGTRELAARLTAAIVTAGVQLKSQRR
jgi:hypothetical protein